jgi:hypothetical protein
VRSMSKKHFDFMEEICLDRDVLEHKIKLLEKELEGLEKQLEELKMRRNYIKGELRKTRKRLEELNRLCAP